MSEEKTTEEIDLEKESIGKLLNELIVVNLGQLRLLGQADGGDLEVGDDLKEAIGLTVKQVPNPDNPMMAGVAPTLSTMDYCTTYIPRYRILSAVGYYRVRDLVPADQKAVLNAYLGFRKFLVEGEDEKPQENLVQPVPAGGMAALEQLAKQGKMPPGIVPGQGGGPR